jgi:hypothetical protein
MALPNFIKAREKAKEAEVKSNIHAIQIALERYSVDTGGFYPLILYGGDVTDTFVKLGSPVNPDSGASYYLPPDDTAYAAFPGDLDAMVQFGYLAQYPTNPFQRTRDTAKFGKLKTDPATNGFGPLEFHFNSIGLARVNIWAQPYDRALFYVKRLVGGEKGNLMWDTSEGQRHAPWPIIVVPEPEPDPNANGYQNPELAAYAFEGTTNYRDDYQFWLTPGNFYYYAMFDGVGGYSSFVSQGGVANPNAPITGAIIGFHLAGYGTIFNAGQDAFNLWGDYPERSLYTRNVGGTVEDFSDLYVGPDGRRDGIIIVVDSGVDVETATSQEHAGFGT